jgi:dihydrofolate synthase/folylpolyglutamate synthase
MTYKESVSWLFNQFPAYQNTGISAYKPDLGNVLSLCSTFDVDFSKLRFIHIAGTNGKGSVSNFLASILFENKNKVGLFTSPHILDFRERIRVNGEMIDEIEVVDFCQLVRESDFKVKPSFFEITWILALIHFIKKDCCICVIETGLGGRLDATNIISPILSIITNVSLDHTNILGNSISQIAYEKAGIIKSTVPVIIGSKESESQVLFKKKTEEMSSSIYYADEFKGNHSFFPKENFQYMNERTVRYSCSLLNTLSFSITDIEIENGFKNVCKNTGFVGRYQTVATKPKIIIDAAHNEAGIINLMESISSERFKKLYVIYGISNDKDIVAILKHFPNESSLNITAFSNARSLSYADLENFQSTLERKINIFNNISLAFKSIQKSVNEEDIILVTGSFFLLSDFFIEFYKNNLLE